MITWISEEEASCVLMDRIESNVIRPERRLRWVQRLKVETAYRMTKQIFKCPFEWDKQISFVIRIVVYLVPFIIRISILLLILEFISICLRYRSNKSIDRISILMFSSFEYRIIPHNCAQVFDAEASKLFEHMTFVSGKGWMSFDCTGNARIWNTGKNEIVAVACEGFIWFNLMQRDHKNKNVQINTLFSLHFQTHFDTVTDTCKSIQYPSFSHKSIHHTVRSIQLPSLPHTNLYRNPRCQINT